MLKLIQPTSKKNQVVLAIKEAILAGSISPGDQIVESRIAQELGSGIPLVREALIELEHQGFVHKTPYKGTIVTQLGPKEIREIFQLRVELEALAVEWAKHRVTPVDIKDLEKLIHRMAQSAAELDLAQFYQIDLDFHRRLWSLSGNSYLADPPAHAGGTDLITLDDPGDHAALRGTLFVFLLAIATRPIDRDWINRPT